MVAFAQAARWASFSRTNFAFSTSTACCNTTDIPPSPPLVGITDLVLTRLSSGRGTIAPNSEVPDEVGLPCGGPIPDGDIASWNREAVKVAPRCRVRGAARITSPLPCKARCICACVIEAPRRSPWPTTTGACVTVWPALCTTILDRVAPRRNICPEARTACLPASIDASRPWTRAPIACFRMASSRSRASEACRLSASRACLRSLRILRRYRQ